MTGDGNIDTADGRIADSAKNLLKPPEGVYAVGQVVKVTVGGENGEVETVYFTDQAAMQAYLKENYPKATTFTGDTTYFSLDSLNPMVPVNGYVSISTDVWSTTPPLANEYGKIDHIVTAFVDKNPPEAKAHQRSEKQVKAIGLWKDAGEAQSFYQNTQPDKIIRDNAILGNAVTMVNPLKPNEIYLQGRPVVGPSKISP